MAKLSPNLKALIAAPFARPDPTAAPAHIADVYRSIASDAAKNNVSLKPWLALSSAATFTLNSPESLSAIHSVATSYAPSGETNPKVMVAEFIREVGLKCISFNGIPRTINCLNAFHASLPANVRSQLETRPTRQPTTANLNNISSRGRGLWDSIYAPFEGKLVTKLATSHPDLPVHILNSHYGPLLADPAERGGLAKTGRILTSVIAISCLRAQTGVAPQVTSHVFGLRKGIEDGTYKAEGEEEVQGVEWLATNEGSEWILRSVDTIVKSLGGSNFSPKL
ncbi:alpha-1,3-mannosyltransferase [Geosmithia morbida]|uniref:Alpha-1,3-mannosyltransferase n=1 Tax=Geosmithia morbida TaxID=1094350 RepID=A0A9P4YTN4_9HYPO|nr:alpha-1,3-mannosyltransferase [Geosmithia morbida]KAF4122903.1 alpha-1,3-mannosyltransferase [Geosmithia morbida]